jgi:phosphatidylethanolamine-binding protein (PEBP) family uncharacterized protein
MFNRTRKHKRKITRKISGGSKEGKGFTVKYGGIVVCHQGLSRQQTEREPEILFDRKDDKQYSLVMYDPDATPSTDKGLSYVHWLLVNITGNSLPTVITPYVAPNPPTTDTHFHRYMFELLEQPGPIQGLIPGKKMERQGFHLDAFKRTHGLKTLSTTGFYVMP